MESTGIDISKLESLRQSTSPRTAYILLWFPEPSETFIFREALSLYNLGLPLTVYTLYGPLERNLSPEMLDPPLAIHHLGIPNIGKALSAFLYWAVKKRKLVLELIADLLFSGWNGWIGSAANVWALFCGFDLARRFSANDIQHIHAPWANAPTSAAYVASRLTDIPFSFTARARDVYLPDSTLEKKLRAAEFIRCNTKRNVDYLKTVCDVGDKIQCVYNGVTATLPPPAPVHMKTPYQLLAIGRFVPKKGYEDLLRCCGFLSQKGIDYELTLAGDGKLARFLKRLAEQLNISERVRFPGYVTYDQVPKLFSNADLFVMPSIVDESGDRDGIPNVIMEAFLHRIPVVAADVSAIGELVINEQTGLLVAQKNPDELAGAILAMLEDREHALQLAEQGKQKVLAEFDPEVNFKRILQLILENTPGFQVRH